MLLLFWKIQRNCCQNHSQVHFFFLHSFSTLPPPLLHPLTFFVALVLLASPGAGIRFLSFACLSHGDTLSPVLAKLTDKWSAPSRKSASFILLYLLVFLQEHLTLYAVKILDSLYRACGEADDLEFSQNVSESRGERKRRE